MTAATQGQAALQYEIDRIRDDGGPAFPVDTCMDAAGIYGHQTSNTTWQCAGMTLRDYFAAKAMQGMLADLPKSLYGLDWQENLASSSYGVADAMLKARKEAA